MPDWRVHLSILARGARGGPTPPPLYLLRAGALPYYALLTRRFPSSSGSMRYPLASTPATTPSLRYGRRPRTRALAYTLFGSAAAHHDASPCSRAGRRTCVHVGLDPSRLSWPPKHRRRRVWPPRSTQPRRAARPARPARLRCRRPLARWAVGWAAPHGLSTVWGWGCC